MSAIDTPYFATSLVLVTMGFASLATSFTLRLKSLTLEKYPENVQVKMFKKTFNIFNPYPERRRVIHENLQWLILIAVYGSFVGTGFAVAKLFEFGFLLAFFTLLVCLGFLLIDETLEVHKNAKIFTHALKKQTLFAKGDIEALNFLRRILPKLSKYHLAVACLFFTTSLLVPFTASVFLSSFIGFTSFLFGTVAVLWFFPPLVLLFVSLIFGATIFVVQFATNKIKLGLLDFPSPKGTQEGMWAQMRSGRYFPQQAWSMHHPRSRHLPDAKHLNEEEADLGTNESE